MSSEHKEPFVYHEARHGMPPILQQAGPCHGWFSGFPRWPAMICPGRGGPSVLKLPTFCSMAERKQSRTAVRLCYRRSNVIHDLPCAES